MGCENCKQVKEEFFVTDNPLVVNSIVEKRGMTDSGRRAVAIHAFVEGGMKRYQVSYKLRYIQHLKAREGVQNIQLIWNL